MNGQAQQYRIDSEQFFSYMLRPLFHLCFPKSRFSSVQIDEFAMAFLSTLRTFFYLQLLLSIFNTTLAAPSSSSIRDTPQPQPYDVLILGGGPSGLQAASSFGRVRRNTLLLDSGVYRNELTRHAHDILGYDGVIPAAFRHLARQQIAAYPTVDMQNATVVKIESSSEDANKTMFVATDSDGKTYNARKVVLGTGMKDLLPSTPGVAEAWGKGVFWCAWCDGYEYRDQALGIMGGLKAGVVSKGFSMQSLNKDVIIFLNGTMTETKMASVSATLGPSWQAQLAMYGVSVENRTIASLTRLGDEDVPGQKDEFLVTFTDGASLKRNAFLTSFPEEQTSDVGEMMGVELDDGGKMVVDILHMDTNVPGVYAVGDANNDGSSNVPHAMFSAKRAAVYIHGKFHYRLIPALDSHCSAD